MMSHVYEFLSLLYAAECGFAYGLRTSDECDYGAVGGFARIDVEEFDFFTCYGGCSAGDCGDYLVDYIFVATFAEVRDAFNDSFHIDKICVSSSKITK